MPPDPAPDSSSLCSTILSEDTTLPPASTSPLLMALMLLDGLVVLGSSLRFTRQNPSSRFQWLYSAWMATLFIGFIGCRNDIPFLLGNNTLRSSLLDIAVNPFERGWLLFVKWTLFIFSSLQTNLLLVLPKFFLSPSNINLDNSFNGLKHEIRIHLGHHETTEICRMMNLAREVNGRITFCG